MPRKKEKPIRKTTGKGGNYRKTKSGAGMTKKGVAAYRKANPGSKLKTAVTGKVKKGSKAAKRRKSYCARSAGQLKEALLRQETTQIQELGKRVGAGSVNKGEKAWAMEKATLEGQLRKKRKQKQLKKRKSSDEASKNRVLQV